MQIAAQKVASFHYTLTNAEGKVIDSSREREPLSYLQGAGNIVPGLEKAMHGRSNGDKFQVEVVPEQGYGQRHPQLVQKVPKSAFQNVGEPKPGMQFQTRGPQGPMLVTVVSIDGDEVTIDGNHPLAGQTLHFDVEVTGVRDANADELNNGRVQAAANRA
ncbi:MAG TPA: peptidylprolyl isomerase [Rudaea sp.]|nr:peptidylprolyl isomerase [Rudaea sp.]